MPARIRTPLIAAALVLVVMAGFALAARCMSLTAVSCSFSTLWSDQPELDVPYAGTRPEVVAAMLDLAGVRAGDHVVDLGTGDGRILIAAARERGAGGEGVDLDPVLIRRAAARAQAEGVGDKVAFRVEDLFRTPLDRADVVTMFLLPEVNLRLRPRILAQMRPGSRIVSHAFDMGEWRPDAQTRIGGSHVYLWIVPAPVAGRWRLTLRGGRPVEIALTQQFQRVSGLSNDRYVDVELRGNRIRLIGDFGEGERRYEGLVEGDRMVALDSGAWEAVRLERSNAAATSAAARPNSSNE